MRATFVWRGYGAMGEMNWQRAWEWHVSDLGSFLGQIYLYTPDHMVVVIVTQLNCTLICKHPWRICLFACPNCKIFLKVNAWSTNEQSDLIGVTIQVKRQSKLLQFFSRCKFLLID